jgi:hypothetical protein
MEILEKASEVRIVGLKQAPKSVRVYPRQTRAATERLPFSGLRKLIKSSEITEKQCGRRRVIANSGRILILTV